MTEDELDAILGERLRAYAEVVVGGAVVTQEFADSIGADYYAKDAMRTVRIAEELAKVPVRARP